MKMAKDGVDQLDARALVWAAGLSKQALLGPFISC
jgi:hypothetical protein